MVLHYSEQFILIHKQISTYKIYEKYIFSLFDNIRKKVNFSKLFFMKFNFMELFLCSILDHFSAFNLELMSFIKNK